MATSSGLHIGITVACDAVTGHAFLNTFHRCFNARYIPTRDSVCPSVTRRYCVVTAKHSSNISALLVYPSFYLFYIILNLNVVEIYSDNVTLNEPWCTIVHRSWRLSTNKSMFNF